MAFMASKLLEAITEPIVPLMMITSAGTLMKAGSALPSMVAPRASPTNATTIPIAVVAFMADPPGDRQQPRDLQADAGHLTGCRRARIGSRRPPRRGAHTRTIAGGGPSAL